MKYYDKRKDSFVIQKTPSRSAAKIEITYQALITNKTAEFTAESGIVGFTSEINGTSFDAIDLHTVLKDPEYDYKVYAGCYHPDSPWVCIDAEPVG